TFSLNYVGFGPTHTVLVWKKRNLISIRNLPETVASLKGLENVPSLKSISINGTKVNDLTPLSNVAAESETRVVTWPTVLTEIEAYGAPISDLSPLATVTTLTYLQLNKTKVSDLSPLKGLRNLERLELFDTPVSDL